MFVVQEADFEPILALVGEMTQKGIRMTGKSFASLVDAASLSRSLQLVHKSLSLARSNGACRAYSRDTAAIALPPRDRRAVQGTYACGTDVSPPPTPHACRLATSRVDSRSAVQGSSSLCNPA
jgi:hypothetical protein